MINLGFLTERKQAAILIILSSWGSQRAGLHHAQGPLIFHINLEYQCALLIMLLIALINLVAAGGINTSLSI
jgi:hypothetical protein